MANYAIALSFIKANTTVVRGLSLTAPRRYFAVRDPISGYVTLPTLDPGDAYNPIEGLTSCNFQISDTNTDFRLLGDDGWNDSVITGSGVQGSCTGYFLKKIVPGNPPTFLPDYSPGFELIQRSRYDKDYEVYFEFLKNLGNNELGESIFDFSGFNAVIQNYTENQKADGLLEINFDLMSRGKAVFGRYKETTGGIKTLVLTAPGNGYKPGTYADCAINGGFGSGATCDVIVAPTGEVQSVTLAKPGSGYKIADVLTVSEALLGGQGANMTMSISDITLIKPVQSFMTPE